MKTGLTTDRLTLVPIERQHKTFLLELFRNEQVRRFLFDGQVIEDDVLDKLLQNNKILFSKSGIGLWLMTKKETSQIVGVCGFFKKEQLEIVYVVHPTFQGMGYATEGSRKALAYAHESGIQESVFAKVDETNEESHVVAERIGMTRIGEDINTFTGTPMRVYKLNGQGLKEKR